MAYSEMSVCTRGIGKSPAKYNQSDVTLTRAFLYYFEKNHGSVLELKFFIEIRAADLLQILSLLSIAQNAPFL